MKKALLIATLLLTMTSFTGAALAQSIDFTDQGSFAGNIFTGSDGTTLTLTDNNAIQGWDNKGLLLKFSNDSQYLDLVFSSAVNIDRLDYSNGGKKAVLQIYIYTDSGSPAGEIAFDPSHDFIDLSGYAGITSLTIKRDQNENGNVGNFYINGLTYGPSAVPVPAAVWLMGSGLAGLVALRRRMR